jgi:hypothetical protein
MSSPETTEQKSASDQPQAHSVTAPSLRKRIHDAAVAGDWVDLSKDPNRVVDPTILRELLSEGGAKKPIRGLNLRGAVFEDALDLRSLELCGPLRLDGCEFKGHIDLREASAPTIRITGSGATHLVAEQLNVRGDLSLERSEFNGGVYLHNAHVGGHLSLTGAKLTGAPALNAEGMTIGKGAFLCGDEERLFEAEGELRLATAEIGGDLTIRSVRLGNPKGHVIFAQRLCVKGSLHCSEVEVEGLINLVGAHVLGQFTVRSGSLTAPGGVVLNGDGIQVDQDLFFEGKPDRPLVIDGKVGLPGVRVGGQLAFEGLTVGREGDLAIDLDGGQVEQDLLFRAGDPSVFRAIGGVGLLGAWVKGRLSMEKVAIEASQGPAFNGEGLRADGSIAILGGGDVPSLILGECRLVDARVGQSMTLLQTVFKKGERNAVAANRLKVEGSCSWREVVALGAIECSGADLQGELTLDACELWNPQGIALGLNGIRVGQRLSLGVSVSRPTRLRGETQMAGAQLGAQLTMEGASLDNKGNSALTADRVSIAGGFVMVDCAVFGQLRLAGAHLAGQFNATDVTLENADVVFAGDGLQVREDFFLTSSSSSKTCQTTGEVRLVGARVDGQLNIHGATLAVPRETVKPALNLEGAQVGQGVFCRPTGSTPTEVVGELRLTRARIDAHVTLESVRLQNDNRIALNGKGLVAETDVILGGVVNGAITLDGSCVRGDFSCLIELSGSPGKINLSDASFGSLGMECRGEPEIDLRRAEVGVLHPITSAQGHPRTHLEGCTYRALAPSDRNLTDVEKRLDWIAADPDGYSSQSYEQLRTIYRQTGFESGARKVGIFSQQQRQKNANPFERAGSRIVGATVGYGYRPSQALLWLIAVIAVGALLFGCLFSSGKPGSGADLTSLRPAKEEASLEPIAYTIDLLIPGVDLGQQSAWDAHGFALWVGVVITAVGWLLAAAVLAGVSVRRD